MSPSVAQAVVVSEEGVADWDKRCRRLGLGDHVRLLCRDGLGRKSDPFRYWLPGRADMLRPNPGPSPEEVEAWNQRLVKEYMPRLEATEKKNAAGERRESVP
jgi:hypothetical protein